MLRMISAALQLDVPNRKSVFHKIKTGVVHPKETCRVVIPRIHDYWARERLIKKGFSKEVQAIEKRFNNHEIVGQPWAELYNLVMMVQKYDIKHVLEFGSGRSTILLGAITKVTSIDADKKWVEINREYLPEGNNAEIIYSPVHTEEYDGEIVLFHDNIPENIDPDFVYLDGPAFDQVAPGCKIAADIVKMDLKKGTVVVVDGRKKNTDFLKMHLSYSEFWEICGPPFGQGFSQPCFKI